MAPLIVSTCDFNQSYEADMSYIRVSLGQPHMSYIRVRLGQPLSEPLVDWM